MSLPPDFPIPHGFDPGDDPDLLIDRLTTMFVRAGQERRIALGQRPAERAVFRKVHGVAAARLEPHASCPPEWRAGLLEQQREAWVRFSSDAGPTDPDLGSTLGIGVKVFGVEGVDPGGEPSRTADLIMQNWPVFFVDDLEEMVEFTYAGVIARDYPSYLADHPVTRRILDDMSAAVSGSVLTTRYWGELPFHLGDTDVVKYRLAPQAAAWDVPDDDDDYLAVDLLQRLSDDEYRFTLEVQRFLDPTKTPLDRATVEWPEAETPFVPVADLVLPRQDVGARGQDEYGQNLAFNIWRTAAANRPAAESSIALARRVVYAAGADARHTANGDPLGDPTEPRGPQPAAPADSTIVQAIIHPAIGVARVGTSPDEYVVGPEVTHPAAAGPGGYRDAHGRLKRQAARFRIYGINADRQIVRELTGAELDGPEIDIQWQVELANTKAAWYGFEIALDIPEASSAPPTTLRNATVGDRASLAITPGPRRIHGPGSEPQRFDTGTFLGTPVDLGEMHTDGATRLVVLGGHGVSASHDGGRAITFANNDGWHDDVADGPVTAEVRIDGQPIEVIGAWVVVGPPNYAPSRRSVRTMWDLMRDVAVTAGTLAAPERPSFTFDILPIFERMAGLQWVNAGFAAGFGHDGAVDLTSPEALARLASGSPADRELRRVVANQFREYQLDGMSPKPWPWVYGDAMNIPAVSPRQHAVLTALQTSMLAQWVQGWFVPDWDPGRAYPSSIDEVPVAEQGEMLTRAALEFCLADAFHPGCEMTWPVRAATMYERPFRFLRETAQWKPPAMGSVLTPDTVTGRDGPLWAQRAGDITRWMAVPWQTDTASCRSGYESSYDPYLPTFWAARVPNQVLTAENYEIVMDESRPLEERRRAFANRASWNDPLGGLDYVTQINNMIDGFDHLGVVESRPGTPGGPFPEVIEVEDSHRPISPGWDTDSDDDSAANEARLTEGLLGARGRVVTGARRGRPAADVDLTGIDKVRRFPNGLLRPPL